MTTLYTNKLQAGGTFVTIEAKLLNGETVQIGQPQNGLDWQMVVIYRGRHCPLCTRYLNQLQGAVDTLKDIGVDLIAVSGDSKDQLESHMQQLDVNFPIAYGLSLEQMKALGVYISDPRSPAETDHPFAEPGLFVVNDEGIIQVIDISNNPFARPELETLVNGLAWIRDPNNHYPIRGMHK